MNTTIDKRSRKGILRILDLMLEEPSVKRVAVAKCLGAASGACLALGIVHPVSLPWFSYVVGFAAFAVLVAPALVVAGLRYNIALHAAYLWAAVVLFLGGLLTSSLWLVFLAAFAFAVAEDCLPRARRRS